MTRTHRNIISSGAAIVSVVALFALSAAAQTAKQIKGATPLVAVANEAPVKLIGHS